MNHLYLLSKGPRVLDKLAAFSTAEKAELFRRMQHVDTAYTVESMRDLTSGGVSLSEPEKLAFLIGNDEASPSDILGLVEVPRVPGSPHTVPLDPCIDGNSKGLVLFHVNVVNGRIDYAARSFGAKHCHRVLKLSESPHFDEQGKDVYLVHCFAVDEEDAKRIAEEVLRKQRQPA